MSPGPGHAMKATFPTGNSSLDGQGGLQGWGVLLNILSWAPWCCSCTGQEGEGRSSWIFAFQPGLSLGMMASSPAARPAMLAFPPLILKIVFLRDAQKVVNHKCPFWKSSIDSPQSFVVAAAAEAKLGRAGVRERRMDLLWDPSFGGGGAGQTPPCLG